MGVEILKSPAEGSPIFSGAGLTTSALHRRELLGVFSQFAPLLSGVQIHLPNCRIRSCIASRGHSVTFFRHTSARSLICSQRTRNASCGSRHVAYPETHLRLSGSGGCSILHVEAEVLDATGELGNSPGRISLDEIVGTEILIEGAVF